MGGYGSCKLNIMIGIKVLSKKHGLEVIDFFEKLGFRNPRQHTGNLVNIYYFINNGRNIMWDLKLPQECILITFLEEQN